jgi:hypothetical protein
MEVPRAQPVDAATVPRAAAVAEPRPVVSWRAGEPERLRAALMHLLELR